VYDILFAIFTILFCVVKNDNFPISHVIHFLLNFSEAVAVVPEPPKKSRTKSPSCVVAEIIRSNNFSSFRVG